MNAWAILYLVYLAFGFGAAVMRWSAGNGTIRLTIWDIMVSPVITVFILYMAGFFE